MVTAVCFTPRLFRCGNDRSARRDASGFSFRRPGRTRCEAPMSKSTQSLLMTAQARQDSASTSGVSVRGSAWSAGKSDDWRCLYDKGHDGCRGLVVTGPAGLEPATPGFGDRCSAN